MGNTSNRRSLEATFSELLEKIQKLTASNMRRLEELVEQGVYIPGSNPDDNSDITLPSGKRDVKRKSPEKPIEDQMLGDVVDGPEETDAVRNHVDGFEDDAVDMDAAEEQGQTTQEESTVDPEVRNVQTHDDKVSKVAARQIDDYDDGFSMDIFDDDGTVCEDEEGNEECLVVTLNGLHSNDDIGQIDCFETTIAPIYDENGNIDEIALRDAAFKRASEILDAKITDADTIVLQTKQDAVKKLHDAENNFALLPANYRSEDGTPTTVVFPNGSMSDLAQIIGNNPILDPVPPYVKNDAVMPPLCIGSSQNADWAPYVCLVKRPALLGGFSLSIAAMGDNELEGDKHAIGLRNKGIKELHNDLQTFAKYHNGTVINRPKEGTDANADSEDENCICTYCSVPKKDESDEFECVGEEDEGSDDPSSYMSGDVAQSLKQNIEKPNPSSGDDVQKQSNDLESKKKNVETTKDDALRKQEDLGNKTISSFETNADANGGADIAKVASDLDSNADVKNGCDVKDLPKTDDEMVSQLPAVGESDGFDDDAYVPADEIVSDGDADDEDIVADIPFPGFKIGEGEHRLFLDIIERVFDDNGALYRRLITRSFPDRRLTSEKVADIVCADENRFTDICNAIADDWVMAINSFLQVDAFRFEGPVDFGPEGFDDHVYASMDPDVARDANIEVAGNVEVPKEELLRNLFAGRTEDELFDELVVETDFVDTAVEDVSRLLTTKWYDDVVDAIKKSL